VATALEATLRLALEAPPDAGSLDYNARNVVLWEATGGPAGASLAIVDFAASGVDWPARRLVQYGTATGAGVPGGTFRTVIGPGAVAAYAAAVAPLWEQQAAAVAQAVDAHDVLLLLTAAAGLASVAAGTAHPERAGAWADGEGRRRALLALLRRALLPSGPAEALRAALR
jgi:hypothetical protein